MHYNLLFRNKAGAKYHKNRLVCGKSMIFDTPIVFNVLNQMRCSAKLNFYFLSNGCYATDFTYQPSVKLSKNKYYAKKKS